ncbi:BRO family protein [Taylorella asinigenitalis]|uniref:BRO family protein n=1 Tax=Taylorella asinigenitalis TaxID=84590 RepID=UPI000490EF07|nr:BRO family protein [Taylorella asinigenitalis]
MNIKKYEGYMIRSTWVQEKEEWYFSIIDVVRVLTESSNARRYWSDLKVKIRDIEGGNQLYDNIVQLKMKTPDGKYRTTDASDLKGIFRIIQSIPSPKAEPFKLWLSEMGKERFDEIADPELIIDRALQTYLSKGYTREWINQRLQAIQVRKELTDVWNDHGVSASKDYAILTNLITQAWSGMNTREYKNLKGLTKESLRDNMTTTELVLNMLAETATKDITTATSPSGMDEHKKVAIKGGNVAKIARESLESETGKPVISSKNALDLGRILANVLENKSDD